jgi:adenylate kinase
MLNIIIFGPPNCGKGTQAALIKEKYNLVHLSTGDLLRAERQAGTELGKAAQAIMDRGDLVSDDIILGMIGNKLDANKDGAGFLFDGFPRTVPQKEGLAALLASKGTSVAAVISLLVGEEELRTRVQKRAIEQGRADDTIEVFERRMDNYKTQTQPLANLYGAEGLLREIDGMGTIKEVFSRVETIMDPLSN